MDENFEGCFRFGFMAETKNLGNLIIYIYMLLPLPSIDVCFYIDNVDNLLLKIFFPSCNCFLAKAQLTVWLNRYFHSNPCIKSKGLTSIFVVKRAILKCSFLL
eukprot:TRINITY_DN18522_c2_g1_i1.p1 TRINITY_DN18522_c2_g1~~TRINITY_DN18522_c2_g1_i1.p1  ORF type:complete len:103 (+),score=1.00 TRINITY_DN18522_c2_g1_i1:125-433(+)